MLQFKVPGHYGNQVNKGWALHKVKIARAKYISVMMNILISKTSYDP